MYVKIGPYKHYFGVYVVENFLRKIGISKEKAEKIGDYLLENKIFSCLQKIINSIEPARKIIIRTHNYDHWGADNTIAMIAVPILKDLRKAKQGSPFVDDEYVPDHLKSTSCPKPKQYDIDDNFHKRWEWVLDEIIWSLEQASDDSWEEQFYKNGQYDKNGHKKYNDRINNGLKLFGIFFRDLWD
jgi:hypothetical protein